MQGGHGMRIHGSACRRPNPASLHLPVASRRTTSRGYIACLVMSLLDLCNHLTLRTRRRRQSPGGDVAG